MENMVKQKNELSQASRLVTVMFSGGGTGGSVSPLLAVAEELIKEQIAEINWQFLFVGTENGLEQKIITSFSKRVYPITFLKIKSGKWRRYFSWKNIRDVFLIIFAYFQALKILKRRRPEIVITAGGFVSVPLVWAAASLKIPIIVHQQDLRPGLANKLMAPWARAITVTFEKSLIDYGPRSILIGNPMSTMWPTLTEQEKTLEKYQLNLDRPLVLVMGGGTGAVAINDLLIASASQLKISCQLFHITGHGKLPPTVSETADYRMVEFVDNNELIALIRQATLVVSRAGIGALTELAILKKPVIIIPIPASHQEENTAVFARAQAALVLKQTDLTPAIFYQEIKKLLEDEARRKIMSINIAQLIKPGASAKLAAVICEIIGHSEKYVSQKE